MKTNPMSPLSFSNNKSNESIFFLNEKENEESKRKVWITKCTTDTQLFVAALIR